jgi:hypothetical protein
MRYNEAEYVPHLVKVVVPNYKLPVLASYKGFEIRDLDLMIEKPRGSEAILTTIKVDDVYFMSL